MSNIRLMIADNDRAQIDMITAALSKQADFEITSTVSNRETVIKQITEDTDMLLLNPDILKQRTLTRFIQSVHAQAAQVRIVLLLRATPPDEGIIADIKAGIRGYIKSSDSAAGIAKAIRAVQGGEIWAERRVLEKAIAKPMLLPETLTAQIPGAQPLTSREMEMLTMVLQGSTNREIAGITSISERTVKTHLYRIYKKLKVKSRTKAIALLSQA